MNHLQLIQNKIYDRARLQYQLNIWRFNGKKIVFTNGCFDTLHLGHRLLCYKVAADLGHILVIGVNTDASVSALKGPNRPVNSELSRTTLLASLRFVDAVILFNEPTPYELIGFVQPDMLVKGADYKKEDIVGYDIVTGRGGSVETIEFLPGYSSSGIIHRRS